MKNINLLLCYGCKKRVQEVFSGEGFFNLCSNCSLILEKRVESMIYFNNINTKVEKKNNGV